MDEMTMRERVPADLVLHLARQWFSEPKNHELDTSPSLWLPENADEDAAIYLARFGCYVLQNVPDAALPTSPASPR